MKKKILLAEDDPSVTYILKQQLGHLDVEIVAAENGVVALDHLKKGTDFALIICDIVMTKLDGIEFRKHVLTDEKYRQTPFIFLTGQLAESYTAQKLDPYLVLTKPIMPADLQKIIENIIFEE